MNLKWNVARTYETYTQEMKRTIAFPNYFVFM